jgi:indolepyruvate ferredoxin oxidoreductase beta subunit
VSAPRPITLLIAALGGEGGGVLTNWIVEAAGAEGLPVQSTSIPGVAQRTGATTYYIEILPTPWRALEGKRPVLSLVPGAGDVDIVAASELLEAARAVANGFVSKDRTAVIASTHRIYAMTERLAMGDARLDVGNLLGAIERRAQSQLLFDMAAAAQRAGSVVNAVMLGAIAASGRLPIPPERFAAAIRTEGKSVEANLRGFAAGLAAVGGSATRAARSHKRPRDSRPSLEALEREAAATMPEAQEIAVEGLRRLTAYQDLAYARLYLDRLAAIRDADARSIGGGTLLRETARHLALRMSFEDVIRVAQAKIDPARMKRIRDDLKLAADEPLAVVEFLKPGIEELCSILPPALARPVLALAHRRGWLGRVHWSMDIRSTSVTGFLRLKLLASLRPWRVRSYRYLEEQAAIEAWLGLIAEGAALSGALALEIALCAQLAKGYGDTHARGVGNFAKIERRLIRPAVAGAYPPAAAVDAIAAARVAALADPDGEQLEKTLAEIERAGARRAAAE